MEDIFQDYLCVLDGIKKLEEQKKNLQEKLLDWWNGELVLWDQKLQKVEVNKVVLKEDVTKEVVENRFGFEALKTEINMDYIKSNPEAHDLLEIKKSEYLKVTTVKEKK